MMPRSALFGTAGVLLLVVVSQLVLSVVASNQPANAEVLPAQQGQVPAGSPMRFEAPSHTSPLQPNPSQPANNPVQSWRDQGTRLASNEDDVQPSSRRRRAGNTSASPANQPVPTSSSPTSGLPSSLDEALNRFRTVEPKPDAGSSPNQTTSTAPAESNANGNIPRHTFASSRRTPAAESPAANTPVRLGTPADESSNTKPPVTFQPYPQTNAPVASEPSDSTPTAIEAGPDSSFVPAGRPQMAPAALPNSTQPNVSSANSPSGQPPRQGQLIQMRSPQIRVTTAGPESLVLNKPTSYIVSVNNDGQVEARQLMIRVVVPRHATVEDIRATLGTPQEVASAATPNVQVLEWQIPFLPASSEGQLELQVVPTTTQSIQLEVQVAYAEARTSSEIAVLQPELQLAIGGPDDILFGDSQIFRVIARNTGNGPADNVKITIMPIKKGQAPTVIDTIGTIAAGDQKVIELELTAKQAGTLQLRAQTSADHGLSASAAHDVLVRRAELRIAAQGPGIKYAATNAQYELTVTNAGNAPATGISVTAQLPTGATFVSASGEGTLSQRTGQVTWTIDSLAPGASHPLQLVSTLMVEGNNILNVAAQGQHDLTANSELMTRVESVADLKLLVNDPAGPIQVGDAVRYEFALENRGTKEARGVAVVVSFDPGIEPLSIEEGQGSVQGDRVQLTTIPSFAAGEKRTIRITARGRSAGNHTFRAQVTCDDPTTRLAIEESTHFYGNEIGSAASNSGAASGSQANPAPLSPQPFSRYQ